MEDRSKDTCEGTPLGRGGLTRSPLSALEKCSKLLRYRLKRRGESIEVRGGGKGGRGGMRDEGAV